MAESLEVPGQIGRDRHDRRRDARIPHRKPCLPAGVNDIPFTAGVLTMLSHGTRRPRHVNPFPACQEGRVARTHVAGATVRDRPAVHLKLVMRELLGAFPRRPSLRQPKVLPATQRGHHRRAVPGRARARPNPSVQTLDRGAAAGIHAKQMLPLLPALQIDQGSIGGSRFELGLRDSKFED